MSCCQSGLGGPRPRAKDGEQVSTTDVAVVNRSTSPQGALGVAEELTGSAHPLSLSSGNALFVWVPS